MIFLSMIKLVFFIAILIFFGWQFTRRVLKQNELYVVIPVSFIIGLSGYIIVINALGYVIDIRLAFFIGLAILLTAGLGLFAVKKKNIFIGLDKKHLLYLSLISLAFILFFTPIYLANNVFDEGYHGPLISTIANGNFPVMSYFTPDRWAQYHYAFDLLAAAISVVTGVPAHIGSIIGMVLVLAPIFWMAFAVIFKLTKSAAAGYITAWLLFFGGGLRYLTVLKDLPWGQNRYIWDYLGQIMNKFSEMAVLGPGYFHSYSVDAMGTIMYHRPMFFSFLVMPLVLWFMYLEHKRGGMIYRVCLGITLGFLALSAETTFVLLALAWGIWKLIEIFRNKNQIIPCLQSLLVVGILASAVAIFQGGVITDAVFHNRYETAVTQYNVFEIRRIPGLMAYDKFFPFNQLYSWFFFIIEWGLPVLLLPFAAYQAWKNKNHFYRLFLIAVIVGSLIIFFVHYPVSPGEMVRVNVAVYLFILLILGGFLANLFRRGGGKKKMVIMALVLMSVSLLLFNLRAWPSRLIVKPMMLATKNIDDEKAMASMARKLVPDKEPVLTASPLVVTQLWGRIAFFGSYDFETNSLLVALPRLLERNDLAYIKSRGVNYLYYNPDFSDYGGEKFIEQNKSKLELLFSLPDNKYRLYKIL